MFLIIAHTTEQQLYGFFEKYQKALINAYRRLSILTNIDTERLEKKNVLSNLERSRISILGNTMTLR